MPSNAQVQLKYRDARRALNNIARSRKATKTQRAAARKARSKLTLDFVDQNFAAVEQRTRQFGVFITEMKQVIKRIGTASPIKALGALKEVVEKSEKLIAVTSKEQ